MTARRGGVHLNALPEEGWYEVGQVVKHKPSSEL